jgi:hypothetical protein
LKNAAATALNVSVYGSGRIRVAHSQGQNPTINLISASGTVYVGKSERRD